MRPTLDIDDDVLQAAKHLANRRRTALGKIISDLARRSLRRSQEAVIRNGVPVLQPRPKESPPLNLELVTRLRDEEGG